jgi:regulator of protease activity HflC (stomatin/prohibitin superfamily)
MNQFKEFMQWLINAVKIWVIVQPWETGLRVRSGKDIKKIEGGLHFKIPYLDSIYVQEKRLRICTIPIQTLTTKDGEAITIDTSLGYSVSNIKQLYNTLFHPETTVSNIAKSEVAEYIFSRNSADIIPKELEIEVLKQLQKEDYGLKIEYFKIATFARVKTFRIIQDQSWTQNELKMTDKK